MRRSIHVVALAGALAVLLATLGAGAAFAVTPVRDIASAGPLEHIYLGDELSCQVDHTADTDFQFFPRNQTPGDCGTFLATGGALYAPDFVNHIGSATGGLGANTPFTPAGQTAVTGTGTAADPFRVVTTVTAGQTGLTIEQTDSYVVGDEAYRTDVEVTNNGSSGQTGVLYRAADCFLGGTDNGFGFTETFGSREAVGCSQNANNTPPGRILEWVPLTGGNNFYQANFDEVWQAIGAKAAFPDTCECAQNQDNGAGISWSFSLLPDGGSATFSHITTFSPTGLEALETTKTADAATSTAGTQNGYTITISNPNPVAVTLDSIQDTLPAGFSYVANSSTGGTTNNPTITGQTLTWTGPPPIVVPANGNVQLHFNVLVSNTPGEYLNQAGGEAAGGFTVVGTGPTAPITVTALSADLSVTKTDSPDPVQVGAELTYTITVANAGPNPAADVVLTDTLPPNVTFGSAVASQGSCTQVTTTVTCNLGTVTVATPATVTIKVTPTTDVDLSNTASVDATTADPVATNDSDTETTQVDPRPLSADLSVTKTDSPDPVTVGQALTYTIMVSNAGPDPAAGVTVTDTLPAGVTFGSATASQGTGCTHATGTVTCNLGTVTVATPATVTITVTPTAPGVLSNAASVSSTTADPVSANNTDSETTQANAPAGPMCNGLPATFVGGPGNTNFQGGPGVDVVVDLGGNNYLQTGGGNDHICLGGGNDEVDSGDGNDFVDAGGGKNKVKTGNGNDVVLSGMGDDELDTGNGVDMVTDTGGKNKIYTGNEADQVTAGSGHDEIDTGDGDDVVAAGDGSNEVKAGNGNDQITAGAGDDKVDGGNGFDTCNAGGGRNEVKDCEAVARG